MKSMTRSARRPCERGYRARSTAELCFAPTRSMPQCWRAEGRDADDDWMENKAECQIDDCPNDDGDDVVFGPALRNWRRTRIFAVLERDPIVYRPSQNRSEQHDAAEIAIRAQMGESPGLHADQHWMFERAFDVAGNVGCGQHDARRPHQHHDNVPRPGGRIPNHDHA